MNSIDQYAVFEEFEARHAIIGYENGCLCVLGCVCIKPGSNLNHYIRVSSMFLLFVGKWQLTSGYLSREQLVRVLNLTASNLNVSNTPLMLSRWLASTHAIVAATAAMILVLNMISVCDVC